MALRKLILAELMRVAKLRGFLVGDDFGVIDGVKEAMYAWVTVYDRMRPTTEMAVLDLGGGSTQIARSFAREPAQKKRHDQLHINEASKAQTIASLPFFKMAPKSEFEMYFASQPSTLGAGCKTRLHTPKAVTYHEQPHYCRFMIGHSLGRMESSISSRFMIGHSLGRMESSITVGS